MKQKKYKPKKIDIDRLCYGRQFNDEKHRWNFILSQLKLEAIQPQKATRIEMEAQEKHMKRGVPNWGRGKRL